VVDESRDPDARPGDDLPGSLLSTIGFLGIVFGLIEGQTYGWWHAEQDFLGQAPGELSVIPLAFAVGVLALALASFLAVERARASAGRPVLVDFTLFRIPSFRYGNGAVLIVGLGEFGLVFVIPLFLQSGARAVRVRSRTAIWAAPPIRRPLESRAWDRSPSPRRSRASPASTAFSPRRREASVSMQEGSRRSTGP
jgi:hypothetical protein